MTREVKKLIIPSSEVETVGVDERAGVTISEEVVNVDKLLKLKGVVRISEVEVEPVSGDTLGSRDVTMVGAEPCGVGNFSECEMVCSIVIEKEPVGLGVRPASGFE